MSVFVNNTDTQPVPVEGEVTIADHAGPVTTLDSSVPRTVFATTNYSLALLTNANAQKITGYRKVLEGVRFYGKPVHVSLTGVVQGVNCWTTCKFVVCSVVVFVKTGHTCPAIASLIIPFQAGSIQNGTLVGYYDYIDKPQYGYMVAAPIYSWFDSANFRSTPSSAKSTIQLPDVNYDVYLINSFEAVVTGNCFIDWISDMNVQVECFPPWPV